MRRVNYRASRDILYTGSADCIPLAALHCVNLECAVALSHLPARPTCTLYLSGIVFVRAASRSSMQNVVLVLPVPVLVGHHQIHVI